MTTDTDPPSGDDDPSLTDPGQIDWQLPGPKWCAKFASAQVASVVTGDFANETGATDFTAVMLVAPHGGGMLMQRAGLAASDPFRFQIGIDAFNVLWVRVPVPLADPLTDLLTFGSGDKFIGVAPTINLGDGNRHHFALVREAATYRIYIDGQMMADDGRKFGYPWPLAPLPAGTLAIGGDGPPASSRAGAGALFGDVFGAGVWSRALTVLEINRVAVGYLNGHRSPFRSSRRCKWWTWAPLMATTLCTSTAS
jgi:hypothetical protein